MLIVRAGFGRQHSNFPASAPVVPNDRGFFLSNRGGEITDDGEKQL